MWLYGTIDRAIGHYRHYDKSMMCSLLAECGLESKRLKYINALGALGWYVHGRFRAQDTSPSRQLRLFNHVVPMLKVIGRVVPMVFGISILAVGCKPILFERPVP